MNETTDLTNAVDEWLAAGADSQPQADAVDATMEKMLKQPAPQPPDGFQRALDEMRREIAILQIVMLTGMNYDEAVTYLKRRGE